MSDAAHAVANDDHAEDELIELDAAVDRALVGGKAEPLGRARVAGLRVPPGVVVTTAARDLAAPGFRRALEHHLAALGSGPFAVRSSAVGEDSAARSFAGQLETILHVAAADVLDAVQRCRASASALRALRYHEAAGAVAVLIQPMLDAGRAGVAFGADPRTGERGVVVLEAVRGLGDRLVSGETDAEGWRVTSGSATRTRTAEHTVLTEPQAIEVAALARAMEAMFGAPQDIEWAFVDQQLHLLQSRPITALPAAPVPIRDPAPVGAWERDDHHAVLSPLGWDWFQAYPTAMAAAMREIGVPVQEILATRVGGHLYLQMVMPGGSDGKMPPRWILWLVSRVVPSMRRANRFCIDLVEHDGYLRIIDRWEQEQRPEMLRRIRALSSEDLRRLSDDALLARIGDALELTKDGLTLHARLGAPPTVGVGLLAIFLEDELHWDSTRAFDLVAGSSEATTGLHRGIESVVVQHLDELGDRPFPATWGALFDACPRMAEALASWLAENRLHVLHYDPKHPTLGERPELVLSIAETIVADRRAGTNAAPTGVASAELLAQIRELLGPERFAGFETLLAKARRAHAARDENGAVTVSQPSGLLRTLVLELGRRIEQDIGAAEHAVFLYASEHRAALQRALPDIGALIERRRGEDSWALMNRGPRRFGPPPPPMPKLDMFPAGLAKMTRIFGWMLNLENLPEAAPDDDDVLRGLGLGTRTVIARARVVDRPDGLSALRHGEVLVCRITSPEWSIALGRVAAIVTDEGAQLSHPAIIAREYGLTAVLGVGAATRRIQTGDRVRVDPVEGTVTVLAR